MKNALRRDVGFVVGRQAVGGHAIARKKNEMVDDEVGQSSYASDSRCNEMDLLEILNFELASRLLADVQHLQVSWLGSDGHAEKEAQGTTESEENDD